MSEILDLEFGRDGGTRVGNQAGPKKTRPFSIDGVIGLNLVRLAFLGCLVLAWYLVAKSHVGPAQYIGTPAGVWSYLKDNISTAALWHQIWSTVSATLVAFVLAAVAGVVVGLGLGLLPRLNAVIDPFLTAINTTPRIALAPLFVLIFGLTQEAKIVLAFSIAFFIVLVSARAGIKSIDEEWERVARMYDSNRRQMFAKVAFPVAVPGIMAGLRLAIVYSLLGVITSEFIAAREGVGQLIVQETNAYDLNAVYGLILILVVVATLMNGTVGLLERRLLRWRSE